MNSKIDLESAIMLAWQTSEDIDLLFKHHGDAPKPMTEDEVGNALLGIKILHDMRMEKLMDTYCRKFELDQYCTDPEKLVARENLFSEIFKQKKGKKK
jgi:hypothetical protein